MTARFARPGHLEKFVHYGNIGGPITLSDSFVVIDTETSGFDAHSARVLEVAAVRTNGNGEVLEQFSTLLDIDGADVGATHIHGINPSMLIGAPTFAEIAPALKAFMSGAILVAHNALFDEQFLAAEFARANIDLPVMPGICTFWLARAALGREVPNHRLDTVCDYFDIRNEGQHAALFDALALNDLLPRLLERVEAIGHYVPLSSAKVVPSPELRNRF